MTAPTPRAGVKDAVAVHLHTHRRSGTHLLMEYLTKQMGVATTKSHSFTRRNNGTVVYLLRNPVEVLWSTYRWFVHGRSSNTRIATALADVSFDAFLRGEAGLMVGFDSLAAPPRDSFEHDRGMLYDPIRFWADHVRSFVSTGEPPLTIRYESLVADPRLTVERVAHALHLPMPVTFRPIGRDELVGHAPSGSDAPAAIEQWHQSSLRRLADTAGDLLEQFGYDVPAPPTARPTATQGARTSMARRTAEVRYVSRDDNSGYGVAGRRCIDALITAGVDVAWEPQPTEHRERRVPGRGTSPLLLECYRPTHACDTTVMHTMPEWWSGIRHGFGRGRYVGHSVWELERYPESWHGDAFAADRLWVPTEWNRRTFQRGGVTQPIDVLPHVVSREPVAEPPIDLRDGVTVFTTVASWHPRKRPDWVVEAYARAFRKGDPVLLVVKTAAWTDAWPADNDLQQMTWWQLMQVLRRHDNPPDVMLVNDEFSDAEVNGLVARADCYVSLACSEGWGLGMFDAAVLGTPVITTGYGGHLAYLGADHPGLVPYDVVPVDGVQNAPHFQDGMQWAAPRLDVAAAMMRAIADGTSLLPSAAPGLAARLRAAYSPEVVGQRAREFLAEMG